MSSDSITSVMRLLDTFGSSAQSSVDEAGIHFSAWGQHIYDDSGDNTGQHGVHGTAQAVIALGTGTRLAGPNSRHTRYLNGGIRWLLRSLSHPKKPIDLRKAVKIAELATAVCSCGENAERNQALEILLSGRNADSGGWGFDLADATQPNVVPTLFALRALVECNDATRDCMAAISAAIRFCLDSLPDTGQEDKRRACTYMLTFIVAKCPALRGVQSGLVDEVVALAASDVSPTLATLHLTTFDYRLRDGGTEATAFCTIPTGLFQVWLYLWANREGIGLSASSNLQGAAVANFVSLLGTALPFSLVESCSVAVQICVEFRAELNAVSATMASSPNVILPPPPAAAHNPLAASEERERLYLKMMLHEGFTTVRIIDTFSGGWSDAFLDLCEITDKDGSVMAPQVLKLTTVDDAKREFDGGRQAANYIDNVHRITPLQLYTESGNVHGVIRFDYAGGSLRRDAIIPFLAFMEDAGDVGEVTKAVDEHFSTGLRKIYDNRAPQSSSLANLRQAFEEMRKGTFWSQIIEGLEALKTEGFVDGYSERKSRLLVRVPWAMVANPFYDSQRFAKAWKTSFSSMQTPKSHGDHNPRNVLMVRNADTGPYRPVLIDFHRFGATNPLALDFARFEVGLQVKGLRQTICNARDEEDTADNLQRYEETVNGSLDFQSHLRGTSVGFAGSPALAKVAQVKAALRKCFVGFAGSPTYDQSYFGVLILCYLSYLRPFYYMKLTREQRTFALYSAAKIFERHFL